MKREMVIPNDIHDIIIDILYLRILCIIIYYTLYVIYYPVAIKRGKDRLYIADRPPLLYNIRVYIQHILNGVDRRHFLSETTTIHRTHKQRIYIIYIL